MIPAARRALRALAGEAGIQVAILSGRAAFDVATRVRVGGLRYLGNHGLESGRLGRRVPAERMVVVPHSSGSGRQVSGAIVGAVTSRIPEAWLFVERKGPSVAFHYRAAPDEGGARDRIVRALDAATAAGLLDGYEVLAGRRVFELRPRGAPGKGEALAELIDEVRPAATLVLGDDRSDAAAFAVLRRARHDGRTDGLAVAIRSAEVAAEVQVDADVVLSSPEEAARFLSSVHRLALEGRLEAADLVP